MKGFTDVAAMAITDCKRTFPDGAYLIIGPVLNGGIISADGKVDVGANIQLLRQLIRLYTERGVPIFSQLDYKDPLDYFRLLWEQESKTRNNRYCTLIYSDFYRPLIMSERIRGVYFVPNTTRSRTAKHARKLLEAIKKPELDVEDDIYSEALHRVLH
jgi:hypothetical protein